MFQSLEMRSETGYPFSAYSAAGSNTCLKVMVPNFLSSWSHPSTVPGTVTVRIPAEGMPPPGPGVETPGTYL